MCTIQSCTHTKKENNDDKKSIQTTNYKLPYRQSRHNQKIGENQQIRGSISENRACSKHNWINMGNSQNAAIYNTAIAHLIK